MALNEYILRNRRLETLVENKTTYAVKNAELHLFETHQEADKIMLKFSQPVLASMLEGKKVMHLDKLNDFDFLPGESLILPSDELMCIDFPEASMKTPTRCLAMAIDEDRISKTVATINETRPKADGLWEFSERNFHFTNDLAIQQIINRLIFLFTEDHESKDFFVDLMLQELIIRISQSENQKIYSDEALNLGKNHRLSFIIRFIRKNLDQDLNIKKLSNEVCMSESNFHRVFKNELNVSPIDFINNERIKLARSLLRDPRKRIKEVCMDCGFNSLSYFTRVFRRKENLSPREYQRMIMKQNEGYKKS
ncbi:MAG: AraC family transcriptional regulator [Bacteroidota bacterium]